ncbi:D-2-hydroxyacid dehydrogenase family protein [Chromobacterium violaceum]|uniref:D-3-phosphoglycerate dehydrogenase n=1 Tax=Chromobacterium violaceum TaxID=536 RepID=A0AAX2MDH8_CHRVL|nr:D-2-hydroxyacid dehydrogenase family protein [Chromobacterium violaceum]OLZ79379.1 3-phosphoglycerate dehydrogenase [Chromobacterium violaceum]STB69985.1 D-3-phosphoglycerate dehydrogenase [Chromobacterium violaceum]SUX34467.1 D-3-phosphoglycerate dehydrogenase [Chromobacterium violaceum]
MPAIKLLIPDDYQNIGPELAELHRDPGYRCASVGDLARLPDADAVLAETHALLLIRERTMVDAALLARMPALKLVSQTGKLARNIDVDACTRAGVAVVEGSGSPHAPAELAWLLIMAARRRLAENIDSLKRGDWQGPVGHIVRSQTLGILGFGKIGKLVAGYGRAFGMDVLVWGSERARAEALAEGCRAASSREAFFAEADIVTLHQRLVPATAGNVTLADLSAMKPDALLVNTSRAELIAPGALEAALAAGRPGFAALDVFEQEPVYDADHPLLRRPNVLCTPHLGYAEADSYRQYLEIAYRNAVRFFDGDTSHVLNPEALI